MIQSCCIMLGNNNDATNDLLICEFTVSKFKKQNLFKGTREIDGSLK